MAANFSVKRIEILKSIDGKTYTQNFANARVRRLLHYLSLSLMSLKPFLISYKILALAESIFFLKSAFKSVITVSKFGNQILKLKYKILGQYWASNGLVLGQYWLNYLKGTG